MEPQTTTQETAPESAPSAKKSLNISIPAAIVTGAAIIGLAIMFTLGPKRAPTQPTVPQGTGQPTEVAADIATLKSQDYVRGASTAEVVVIEYSDSDCPYCKQFHDTMKATVDTYKGKVAWAYRFFPLDTLHPNATTEALSLYCVGELGGDTAFWPYLDQIIGITLSPDAKSNEALITFATQQGVDAAMLRTCMTSAAAKTRVAAEVAEAKKAGARGTPFSIAINQKTGKQVVIPGAVDADAMKQMIDSLLK